MKRYLAVLLTAILALPAAAWAQSPYATRQAILASNFDLDGEAADADQVVTVATLADSTTFTIAADPDSCRLVDATVVDADGSITVGTLTIVGFDCWGYPLTVTYNMAGGSGVRTGTVTDTGTASPKRASGAYFSDVTSVISGVLTGEGGAGDTLTVGYTSNSVAGYPMYGRLSTTPSGKRRVDPFGAYDVNCLVTNGAATTDITGVSTATTACFQNVTVGDLLIFNVSGEMFYRKVTTRTDADNVIVSPAVTIPAAGVNFSYRKFFFSTDPQDGWIPVLGWDAIAVTVDVNVNANTGGVVSSVTCTPNIDDATSAVELDTDTVATGAAGFATTSLDLRLLPGFTHCRVSVRFGTGDDADAAAEDITITFGARK